jgi:hypothetical protein
MLLLLSVHGCISLYVLRGGRGILVLVLILVVVLIVVLVLVLVLVVVVVLILRCEEVSKEGKMWCKERREENRWEEVREKGARGLVWGVR